MEELLGLIIGFYGVIGFVLAVNKMPKENNPIFKIIFSNHLNWIGKFLSIVLVSPIMPFYLVVRFIIFICTKKHD